MKHEERFEIPLSELETEGYLPESVKYMKPSSGSNFFIIMGILVLLRRHEMISYPFDLDSLRNPQTFRWGGRLNTHNYKESLNYCLEDEDTKIIFIYLRVENNLRNSDHANTLILFKNIRTIFRFEPNGLNVGNYVNLDLELEREFNYLSDWTYVKHSDIDFSGMGCQGLDSEEVILREKDDPGGFCASWNFWMIEYLIKNTEIIKQGKLEDIYISSCSGLNPMLVSKRPSVKTVIREYNLELIKACMKYLYEFLPLFSHGFMQILKRIDKQYGDYSKSDLFLQKDNASHQGMFLEMIYQVYGKLEAISQDKYERSILTIHGFDLELRSIIMEEMGATIFEPRKKRMEASLKIKTQLKGQAFRIYGVGEAEEPNIKVINSPSNEYDGLYEYKTSGSSGDIYVNEEKNKLIKINTATAHTPQEQEVEKQLSVKELAPKIYWHGYYTIYMEGTDNIFQYSTNPPYENIGIIIMEYLNPDEWMPINNNNINDKQIQTLLDALYKLVVTYKLTNLEDIIGYSGPHTFIKKNEPYEVKFIDYEKFKSFEGNNKTIFLKICNELSLAVRPRMRFLFKLHECVLSRWPHTRSVRNRKSSRKTKFRLDNLETKASMKSKKKSKSKKKKNTKRKKKKKGKRSSKKSKMR